MLKKKKMISGVLALCALSSVAVPNVSAVKVPVTVTTVHKLATHEKRMLLDEGQTEQIQNVLNTIQTYGWDYAKREKSDAALFLIELFVAIHNISMRNEGDEILVGEALTDVNGPGVVIVMNGVRKARHIVRTIGNTGSIYQFDPDSRTLVRLGV
ncbi:MAG: hypothetical protein LBJ83_03245 [Oscillospiraceae bacterium]|nr:hypothetical protein [Oscillospiraceae bacterium]